MPRIVSLLPSATEMLFALGAGPNVLAVSHGCDFPAAALERPKVTRSRLAALGSSREIDDATREHWAAGQSLYQLDAETIAALQPDWIVTQSQCAVCAIRFDEVADLVASDPRLQSTRIETLNPASIEDVLRDLLRLGTATGMVESAERLVTTLRERIRIVAQFAASLPVATRPRVACIEWFDPLMIAGNWVPELIQLAGGISLLAQENGPSQYVSWDALRAADPDLLILMPCGYDLPGVISHLHELQGLPGWSALRAVQEGRVFAVDSNAYFLRSGPRLIDSLEMLAHMLHSPQLAMAGIAAHRHGWTAID